MKEINYPVEIDEGHREVEQEQSLGCTSEYSSNWNQYGFYRIYRIALHTPYICIYSSVPYESMEPAAVSGPDLSTSYPMAVYRKHDIGII